MDNRKEKFLAKLRESLQKITILLVSVFYITQGLFTIIQKEQSILEILGSISLAIVVGIVISSSLDSMGVQDGRKSQVFQDSIKYYSEIKTKATKYFDRLPYWIEYKNAKELEQEKKQIIGEAGLNWKAYIFGYYKEHPERITKEQKDAIHKADRCKIEKITYRQLLSEVPKKTIFFRSSRFGKTEKDYMFYSSAQGIALKIFLGAVCGAYTLVPIITEENIAGLLWNALQVILWVSFGLINYSNSKYFMENEYRQTHVIQKTEYLNEFIVTIENNPDVIKEYDQNENIDKYISEYIKNIEEEKNEKNE